MEVDVLIHFSKAGYLSLLPTILPEYYHVVLSVVYDEVKTVQGQLDNQIASKREKLTKEQCQQFIVDVRKKGSKLPDLDYDTYVPNVML